MVLACCRTGLTMVWRLFIIEPVKVLWCGGLEAVASLITGAPHRYGCARTRVGNSTRRVLLGEADHWTEGFADALADDMEGRVEDLGSAGIAMAAMDNVARRHETKVAKANPLHVSSAKDGDRQQNGNMVRELVHGSDRRIAQYDNKVTSTNEQETERGASKVSSKLSVANPVHAENCGVFL